jgi:ABC-type transporter Mla MlaB component
LAASDESPPTELRAHEPRPEPGTIELDIGGQLARADIPSLCDRARLLLEAGNAERLACDVGAILDPDAVTVDALARLQLTARRLGRQAHVERASPQLRELLAFMGLSGVVPLSARSRLEARWETEQREVAGGIEEEADPADPTA